MAGERGQFQVRASKGVHLVVPRDRIQSSTGLILRTEKTVLFVIPWGRHWIIGTTDTDWDLDKAHPAATSADIDYLLEHVNAVLVTPLTREDVEGVYAGLRPLLAGESESTSKLSREHMVAHPVPGLVVVAGGKYTTYRVMAKDAVDAVSHGLDEQGARLRAPTGCRCSAPRATPRCGTAGTRIAAAARPARRPGRAPAAAGYGSLVARGARAGRRRPGAGRAARRAPTTTCGPRSSTPPRTRAPGTSTTC